MLIPSVLLTPSLLWGLLGTCTHLPVNKNSDVKDTWAPTKKPLLGTSLVLPTSITEAWVPCLVGELRCLQRQPGMGVGWGEVPFQLTSRKTFPGQLSSQASHSPHSLSNLADSFPWQKGPFLPDLSKTCRSYRWSTLHNALPHQQCNKPLPQIAIIFLNKVSPYKKKMPKRMKGRKLRKEETRMFTLCDSQSVSWASSWNVTSSPWPVQ